MTDLQIWLGINDTINGDLWTALQGQGYVVGDNFAVMARADRTRLRPNLELQANVTPALVDRLYLAIDQSMPAQQGGDGQNADNNGRTIGLEAQSFEWRSILFIVGISTICSGAVTAANDAYTEATTKYREEYLGWTIFRAFAITVIVTIILAISWNFISYLWKRRQNKEVLKLARQMAAQMAASENNDS